MFHYPQPNKEPLIKQPNQKNKMSFKNPDLSKQITKKKIKKQRKLNRNSENFKQKFNFPLIFFLRRKRRKIASFFPNRKINKFQIQKRNVKDTQNKKSIELCNLQFASGYNPFQRHFAK